MHIQSIFVKWLEIVIMNAQRVTKKSESEAEYWLLFGVFKEKHHIYIKIYIEI